MKVRTPDIRRDVRLDRKRRDRTYVRRVINELENLQRRGFLSTDDSTRLEFYRHRLRRLSK